jgi:hypothetical protein
MTVCEICTGRHLTSACVIARARVDECVMGGTPDDWRPSNVIVLDIERIRRSQLSPEDASAGRAERHRAHSFKSYTRRGERLG